MELKRLFEIFLRRWPIIVTTFAVTTALTFWWVQEKPDTYRASGTYVIRPRLDPAGQVDVRLIEALIKGVEIPATYASIARSDVVRDRATSELGARAVKAGLSVGAEVVTGTNTVEISAHAREPEIARDFALAVGTATSEYVDELRDTYRLEILDAPRLPSQPVDVKRNLTIAVGAMLGGLLGFAFAAMLETFGVAWRATRKTHAGAATAVETPPPPDEPLVVHAKPNGPAPDLRHAFRLVDSAQPSARIAAAPDLDRDFQRALSHATRSGRSHSLGVMKIAMVEVNGEEGEAGSNGTRDHVHPADDRIELLLRSWGQRSGGTFTYLDDGMFAVLLPDLSASAASKLLADWAEMLSIFEFGTDQRAFEVAIGVREYPRRSTWTPAPPSRATAE